MSFALQKYMAARTTTASPLTILIQLYDGAIRFLRTAQQAIADNDIPARGVALSKAHAIVAELQASLDPKQAPELCQQLGSLYDFVCVEISDANRFNDASKLDGPIKVLGELREGWAELSAAGV